MLKWLTKPWCQKLSKFSRDRPTDRPTDIPTDRPTDMTTPRSSDPELINYQRFLMFRIAGGTNFSFQILKHKQMEEFQPLFYSFWCLRCLLKLSNFPLIFFNLCSHSPWFILNLFNLTSNPSGLNNLNTKHEEWEHRLKKVREKLNNLSKQLGYQIE